MPFSRHKIWREKACLLSITNYPKNPRSASITFNRKEVSMKKVLVTGMSGLIGGAVHKALADTYTLTALNRREVQGVKTHQADITDLDAIQPAFEGQDTVVHLAAIASSTATWEELLQANVIGTRNVFEAARGAGVKRIVYASSGATTAGWEKESPYRELVSGQYDHVPSSWPMITHETLVRPNGIYASSKVWGEALARYYVDSSDLSILCLRIGHVNEADRPTSARDFSVWCSQRDIANMIKLCIEAPAELKFDIFFVLSQNKWSYRDLSHAQEVLGFEPQDAAETYR
jgi:nucleoside-diphosphate-sugar epimerase